MARPVWKGDWEAAAVEAGEVVLFAAWARVEPARGRYDDAELGAARRAVVELRHRGVEPVVALHAGALPDWQIARGGWLDPDALSSWGCYVDRVGHALTGQVSTWIALWTPLAEAGWYDGAERRAARVLLDAQAAAYVQLRRGGRVGVAEDWSGGPLRRRLRDVFVRCLSTGRVGPPFGLAGELSNGTPAVDFVEAIAGEPTSPRAARRDPGGSSRSP